MGTDLPTIENAAEYVQHLQAKYGATPEPNGHSASVLDKDQLLALLVRMEQAYEELQAERDEYRHNLIAEVKVQFAHIPLPPLPLEGKEVDVEEYLRELKKQPAHG